MSDAVTVPDRNDDAATDDPPPAVSVRGLTKTYGDGDETVRAVDDLSFDVEPGTVVGVLGPNGAGKTTTLKSMLGLVVPTSGSVSIAGVDVHGDPTAAYAHVGAMLEGARNVYWRLTVRENLEFFASLGGRRPADVRERHDELLDQLHLGEKADTPVNDLSRGMKQKVSLACTLARDVDVAFLDEPTLGLDVESAVELRRELRRLAEEDSMTVVLSSHDMDVVQAVCDRVVVMVDGRVAADDTVENLVEAFGTQAYRLTVSGLPSDARDRLDERYDVADWTTVGGQVRFEVTLPDGTAMYDLMDDLRAAGATPDRVEPTALDLEGAFLELVGGER
ncbi:ABC transporter ATP-binding protein [Halomarina salina]|uniref:ABC transporter ATP-binding protein n=1 Tax=Halomarina salina TaxID=1872699 RepID=A0ABD5RHX7_9EURY|nr:ABC transporter ATP-binding protein [Halomarina salina]